MQSTRQKLCLALVAVAVTVVAHIGGAEAFHTEQHRANSPSWPGSLADVIAFVELYGWPVELGYLCKGLSLTEAGRKCRFRQIAIHTKTAEQDDHGFNVPADEVPPLHVVIYHVTPLAGEFFLLSADGKLLRAILRARGTDFIPMSDERGNAAASIELGFWQSNIAAIERDVLNAGSKSEPFSQQRR